MMYAIVYLRPDGWWSAGTGWDSVEEARAGGEEHDWGGRAWGIVPEDQLVDIDGDLRLPLDQEPTEHKVEGSFHG